MDEGGGTAGGGVGGRTRQGGGVVEGWVRAERFQNTVKLRGRERMGLNVGTGGWQQLRANRVQTVLFGLAGQRRRAELHVLRHHEIVLGGEYKRKDRCILDL